MNIFLILNSLYYSGKIFVYSGIIRFWFMNFYDDVRILLKTSVDPIKWMPANSQ